MGAATAADQRHFLLLNGIGARIERRCDDARHLQIEKQADEDEEIEVCSQSSQKKAAIESYYNFKEYEKVFRSASSQPSKNCRILRLIVMNYA